MLAKLILISFNCNTFKSLFLTPLPRDNIKALRIIMNPVTPKTKFSVFTSYIYQDSSCISGWERRQCGSIQTSVTNHPCRTRTESRRENSWYKSQLHSFPWQTEQLGQWIWWPRTLHTSVTGVVLRAVHVSPRYDYRLYM